MRILHAINPSRMAGAETFVSRLATLAEPSGWQQRVVTTPGPVTPQFLARNVNVQECRIGGKLNPAAMWRLRRASREFRADLVHSHLSSASWWSGWLESLGGPRSVGHVHGFTSALWHRQQSHLIACSGAVKADLIEKGIPGDRVSVLHNPVGADDVIPARSRQAVRAELGVDGSTPVVGTCAHLSVKKGHRELIEAAAEVLRVIPKAQFWCLGEGPLRKELEQRAAELGIADRFRLLGFRSDVADLMQAMDVMALPSHREPFGLVYAEAAQCGTPSIACDAGGAPEVIVPGETGWLVSPHDIQALTQAILESLTDPTQTQAMGIRAREHCREQFNWPRYVKQLEQVYEQVLDSQVHRSAA